MEYDCGAILIYDPLNRQIDYQYMAKDFDGKYHVGFLVIDQPWYSPSSEWKYYIVHTKYIPGGLCGGCENAGFEWIEVDRDTVEPYNQVAEIKFNQSIDVTSIVKNGFLTVAKIKPGDKIPMKHWRNNGKV